MKPSFSAEHKVGGLVKRSHRGNLEKNLGVEWRRKKKQGAIATKELSDSRSRRESCQEAKGDDDSEECRR